MQFQNLPTKWLRAHDPTVKSTALRFQSYSVRYFPVFGLETKRYLVSLRFQSEYGKVRTRITPNRDTFHAVQVLMTEVYEIEAQHIMKNCFFWVSFQNIGTLDFFSLSCYLIFRSLHYECTIVWNHPLLIQRNVWSISPRQRLVRVY